MDMLGEPVEECTGVASRTEDGSPLVEGQIAGGQGGTALMALGLRWITAR